MSDRDNKSEKEKENVYVGLRKSFVHCNEMNFCPHFMMIVCLSSKKFMFRRTLQVFVVTPLSRFPQNLSPSFVSSHYRKVQTFDILLLVAALA